MVNYVRFLVDLDALAGTRVFFIWVEFKSLSA